MKTNIYGIIGKPLGHSLSPRLHTWAFNKLGHKGIFNAWELEEAQLSDFVTSMRTLGLSGACVTIPYKENIMPFLDKISPRAKSIGAVNTLYWQDGQLCGENTDVDGFKLPLLTLKKAKSALILGAGGASRAVIAGLKELQIEQIFISNHNHTKAESLAQEFEIKNIAWHERMQCKATWIINTTPLGMKGQYVGQSPFDFSANINVQECLAYDLVYNPLQTQFLCEAQQAGLNIQDGLDMFVGQALKQMQLWTGQCTSNKQTREFLLK